jgi:soluble lytic murein transglycosylase-like protein
MTISLAPLLFMAAYLKLSATKDKKMNSVKQWEWLVHPLTNGLCLLCLAGLWAMLTLPDQHAMRPAQTFAEPKKIVTYQAPTVKTRARSTTVSKWLSGHKAMIDPALVYAIIQQESNFNPNAKSPAGARGLMQIMPKTADYMIKRYRLNEVKLASLELPPLPRNIRTADLNDPQVNLLIGQHYLKYLSDKSYIDGNLIYLLTAYNAGPANLIKWQKRFGHLNDPHEFMKRIPFKETRHYVQKVMHNYTHYQAQLYASRQAELAMKAGIWPTLATPQTYRMR